MKYSFGTTRYHFAQALLVSLKFQLKGKLSQISLFVCLFTARYSTPFVRQCIEKANVAPVANILRFEEEFIQRVETTDQMFLYLVFFPNRNDCLMSKAVSVA